MAPKTKSTKKSVVTTLNVGVLIDMSGSMHHLTQAARDGIDEYIRDLKEDEGAKNTYVTLATFDSDQGQNMRFDVWFEGKPVLDVEPVGERYQPEGGTPLYDATARLITTMDTKLSSDAKNMIVVLTDGYENASKEFTTSSLRAMIETYEQRGNWTFVYLGANDPNAKQTAVAMGYTDTNAGYFASNEASLSESLSNVSKQTIARKYSVQMASASSFLESDVSDDTRDAS